jgi:hypothetical protein
LFDVANRAELVHVVHIVWNYDLDYWIDGGRTKGLCAATMTTTVRDRNDGKAWDAGEIADLENSLAFGRTIEEAAEFLCRSGTIDDVRRKANELGLVYRRAPLPPPVPTKANTATRLYQIDANTWGVEFDFDDGSKQAVSVGPRPIAELTARDRTGDLVPIT